MHREFKPGDVVVWSSQWGKRDAAGHPVDQTGVIIEQSLKLPGWRVRRSDGKSVHVRTTHMDHVKTPAPQHGNG